MLDISNQTALEAIEAAIKIKSYKRDKGPEIENVLKIGKLMSDLAKVTPSKKLLGLGLKKKYPEIAEISSCSRSNCRWLYEALSGEQDTDILDVLGVSQIEDFKSRNATVIRREYNKRRKEA